MRPARGGSIRQDPTAILLTGAALVLGALAAGVSESRTPIRLTDRVTWRDLEAAQTLAATEQKPLLVFFTDGRDMSARLERDIFGDRRLGSELDRSFVLTRIDDRRESGEEIAPRAASLEARYGVSELPALVLVARDGSSRTFLRYPTRQRVISFLLPNETSGSARH